MAFLPNSRYHGLPTVEAKSRDGRTVVAVTRRRLPEVTGESTVVKENDRLDLLADGRYNDATRFWHIADANTELEANELVAEAGTTLEIPES